MSGKVTVNTTYCCPINFETKTDSAFISLKINKVGRQFQHFKTNNKIIITQRPKSPVRVSEVCISFKRGTCLRLQNTFNSNPTIFTVRILT